MTFIYNWHFELHCKSEPKQVKGNEIKGGMRKSASTFAYLQCATLFN